MTSKSPPVIDDGISTSESLVTETSRDSLKHENLFNRIARYENAKAISLRNAEYIATLESIHTKLAANVKSCGDSLTFHNYYTIDETRLVSAHFCKKHLICPMCARRRAAKLIGTYVMRYEAIMKAKPYLVPLFITKTVRNDPDLDKAMKHLKESERVFNMRRHRKNSQTQSTKIHSGITSYEITQNNDTHHWHPHSHCIALCTDEIDKYELSAEWNRITGDSYIVDVRPVTTEDIVKGFLELFKYVTKFHEMDAASTFFLAETMRGKRLISPFGDFRGCPVEAEKLTDERLSDTYPYIELVYQYLNKHYSITHHREVEPRGF